MARSAEVLGMEMFEPRKARHSCTKYLLVDLLVNACCSFSLQIIMSDNLCLSVIDIVCLQVYSSSLVDVERDYLSIDKRYPRLFISSEFSKVCILFLFQCKEFMSLNITFRCCRPL